MDSNAREESCHMKVPVVQGAAARSAAPARVSGSTRSLLSTGRDSRFVASSFALLCQRDAGQLTAQDWAVRQDRQVQQWRTGQSS